MTNENEHKPGDIVKIKISVKDPLLSTTATTYNPDEKYHDRFATLVNPEIDDQWGDCWIVMLDDNEMECFKVTEIEAINGLAVLA